YECYKSSLLSNDLPATPSMKLRTPTVYVKPVAPKMIAIGRSDESLKNPDKGPAPNTRPIKGVTRPRLMSVWYRNRFTSARSCPCEVRVSLLELCPYLAAKYIPPAIVSAAISSADGIDSPKASSARGSFTFATSN